MSIDDQNTQRVDENTQRISRAQTQYISYRKSLEPLDKDDDDMYVGEDDDISSINHSRLVSSKKKSTKPDKNSGQKVVEPESPVPHDSHKGQTKKEPEPAPAPI